MDEDIQELFLIATEAGSACIQFLIAHNRRRADQRLLPESDTGGVGYLNCIHTENQRALWRVLQRVLQRTLQRTLQRVL
jgi:hypothetical protein